MKKILFMLSSMEIGGVEKSLISLLNEIPKNKYNITLLLLDKKGAFLKNVPDWINVEEIPWYKTIKPKIMDSPYKIVKDYFNEKK